MFLALTVIAQLKQQPVQGIQLRPAYSIVKPIDIQPTITVQQLQPTINPQPQAHIVLQGSDVCIQACNEPQIQ